MCGLPWAILACAFMVHAAPALLPASPSITTTTPPTTSIPNQSTWSNEAIFTLIGVIIAILGIVITLLLSSPKLRRWLAFPCKYCIKRNRQGSMHSLQKDVEEWLEFKEWKKLSTTRNAP